MNKKVKKLSAAALLVGALLSAATLQGTPTDAPFSFFICEEGGEGDFDEHGKVLPSVPTLGKWNGCLTYFFIKEQNNVSDVSTIQGLLNKGDTAFVNNAICSSTVTELYDGYYYASANGSNPSKLALGDYTAFAVLFDAKSSTEITRDSTKYLVLNDLQQQTYPHYADPETKKVITGYSYQFYHGSAATLASNENNWGTFGVVPEPTSGVMLLLGVAALALKRKRG